MDQLIINGPVKLNGAVNISGAKNAALPIIASALLFNDDVILRNIPNIRDVRALLDILQDLGVKISFADNILSISATKLKETDPNPELVKRLRASVLLLAPLLNRQKKIFIPHPGGCLIGARPIDVHLTAFKQMGSAVEESSQGYSVSAKEIKGATICAEFSVTGTENIIMLAVLAKGTTKISLAAAEPHVQDLCRFLNKGGAKIKGIGTHNLIITGVSKLHKTDYTIISDQIESGTFAIAAAATKGKVLINGFMVEHHESLLSKLSQVGVEYRVIAQDKIEILPTHNLNNFKIKTEIYPGFPTDLQAPMAVLATQANGSSEIYETIFEGRLGYINELSKMGASCIDRDAHQDTITGPTPLHGTRITSFDLRAGATLIVAALIAQGESRLDQIEIIDRGYENIEEKFKKLGANIKRVTLKEIE
jgi:UDP-N-acetylglucosamine 1-carboxyvinyltransferase